MDNSIKKHLYDIATAIEEIDSFFGGRPKVFHEFCNNLCLRRAVERNIEIIGEATNRVLKENKGIAITNEHCHQSFAFAEARSRNIIGCMMANLCIFAALNVVELGRCPFRQDGLN